MRDDPDFRMECRLILLHHQIGRLARRKNETVRTFDHVLLEPGVQRSRQWIVSSEWTINPRITKVGEPWKVQTSLQLEADNVIDQRKRKRYQYIRSKLVRTHELIDCLVYRLFPWTKLVWCSGPHRQINSTRKTVQ